MSLMEILAQRNIASVEAQKEAQKRAEEGCPARESFTMPKWVICPELEAFWACFDGCEEF